MVEQATLSVTIDASEAKKGAAEFSRSAAEIKKKATEIAGAFERSKRSFKGLRAESKQGLGASGLSDEQINSINQQISSIDKSLEKSKLSSFLSSLLKPIFGVPAATAINIAQGNLEEEKRRLESEKQSSATCRLLITQPSPPFCRNVLILHLKEFQCKLKS